MNTQREPFEQEADLQALDAKLQQAMPARPPETPEGLADRIFDATAPKLAAQAEPVIARIHVMRYVGLAAAAAIVLGVTMGVWLSSQEPESPANGGAVAVDTTETELAVETLVAALDETAEVAVFTDDLSSLESEIESLAVALGDSPWDGLSDSLQGELHQLEQQLQQF